VGLSPEEEDVFAEIAFWLSGSGLRGIPWSVVVVAVAVVAIAVGGGIVLGLPRLPIAVFFLTFVIALSVGLGVIALSDRRKRS
jgi:hypothetical protein